MITIAVTSRRIAKAGDFPHYLAVRIPPSLADKIERIHGAAGREWLRTFPVLLEECCARWSLQLEKPFANLSYNIVLPGTARLPGSTHRTGVVLKLGVPCAELDNEVRALHFFKGEGAARLLDQEVQRGALVLERVIPGTSLHLHSETSDADATWIAAALMRHLWSAAETNISAATEESLPALAKWFQAFERLRKTFDGGTGLFPDRLIAGAEVTFAELIASADTRVVLHGDLHHDNILFSASRGWVAIDPKGIIGDPGYEVGSFMLNQLPQEASEIDILQILKGRLEIFSVELGISRQRLARWAFCHAVLSAVWDFEEAADWSGTARLAEMFEQLGR
ncbi:MAG: aminoglycoside phosphotransferase family protein [bacterium]